MFDRVVGRRELLEKRITLINSKELLDLDAEDSKDDILRWSREEGLLTFKESDDLRFKLQQVK